jgi:hypothetical protein
VIFSKAKQTLIFILRIGRDFRNMSMSMHAVKVGSRRFVSSRRFVCLRIESLSLLGMTGQSTVSISF